MIAVVVWRWGSLFGPEYVQRLRSMLARHLRLDHQLYCVTDAMDEVPAGVIGVPMPTEHAETPRCRRRMWQFDRERVEIFGPRMLCVDLDMVIVDDITSLVDRAEPLVCWRIGYANVYSGAFILMNTGVLHGAWDAYRNDPNGYPLKTGERNASDLAMLNYYLRGETVAQWTEADGFVSWFGVGYAYLEHHGMGASRPHLPPGARVVALGGADKAVMDEMRYPFVRQHWK